MGNDRYVSVVVIVNMYGFMVFKINIVKVFNKSSYKMLMSLFIVIYNIYVW